MTGFRVQGSGFRGRRFAICNLQFAICNRRSGLSLLEILVSIFILSIGLLGVAALIPVGKLALVETNKSDRSGALGRAGLREVKVRRMIDLTVNATAAATNLYDPSTTFPGRVAWPLPNGLYGPYAIDPLGVQNGLSTAALNLGGTATTGFTINPTAPSIWFPLPRLTTSWVFADPAAPTRAEQVFRWHDDLLYVLPKDYKGTATNGDRPMPSPLPTAAPASDPSFSWFLTVSPKPQPRVYDVSVVVCYKRIFSLTSGQPAGEQAWDVSFLGGIGYGGGTVQLAGTDPTLTDPINRLKDNQWVMLCGWVPDSTKTTRIPVRCQWYRVVGVNRSSATLASPVSYVSLVGPDWDTTNYANVTLVVVDGVIGVYASTVQLDNDGIWTK